MDSQHIQQSGNTNNSPILKLKGLPYTATEKQVYEFFQGYDVKGVGFVYEPDGRASGLAFTEFNAVEEATRALSQNGQYLGQRFIKLLRVSRQEMEDQLQNGTSVIPGNPNPLKRSSITPSPMAPVQSHPPQPFAHPPPPPYGQPAFHQPHFPAPQPNMGAGGLMVMPSYNIGLNPAQINQQMQMPGFGPRMVPPGRPMVAVHPPPPGLPPGSPALVGGGGDEQQSDMSRFVQDMRHALPAGPIPPPPPNQPPPPPLLPSHILNVPPPPPFNNLLYAHLPAVPPTPYTLTTPQGVQKKVIKQDGSTIKIRGLPFKASKEEIFQFFTDFEYENDSLYLGQDPYGRPSGEAWLSFSAASEARRAVKSRNREYLGNRYLELSLCQSVGGGAGMGGMGVGGGQPVVQHAGDYSGTGGNQAEGC